jgi:hypothetical protein
MAFPALTPTLTDEESMNVIMESEVSIIQCMADLFCNVLVDDIIALATPITPTVSEIDKQVSTLKQIMCGFTTKENAIAAVVGAAAKKNAADLGVNPCDLCCCLNNCKCNND